jgi:hypothetical protein
MARSERWRYARRRGPSTAAIVRIDRLWELSGASARSAAGSTAESSAGHTSVKLTRCGTTTRTRWLPAAAAGY